MPLTPDELLTTTRSVRKRLDLNRPVPLDLVKECLEVALQAPSGGMRQGWHWIVVTDPQVRAQIGDFYRRSAEPYLASAAAADPSRAGLAGLDGGRVRQWLFARSVQESFGSPLMRQVARRLAPA